MIFVAEISFDDAGATVAGYIDLDYLGITEFYVSGSNSDDWRGNPIKFSTISNKENVKMALRSGYFERGLILTGGAENTYKNLYNVPQNKRLMVEKDYLNRLQC